MTESSSAVNTSFFLLITSSSPTPTTPRQRLYSPSRILRSHFHTRAGPRMTENQPPSGGATTDQPGRPYYEQLRTNLRGSLTKKRQIDEQLANLEEQIYKLETSYLEDTSGAGNIIRGFDNWVKGVVIGNDRRADDRKGRTRVRDEDRIFSNSSITWLKVGHTI